MRQYDDEFKTQQRTSLSILKEFGFGNRILETRILTEVSDLILRAKELNGDPFDPDFILTRAVSNVIYSILFGNRLDCSGSKMENLINLMRAFMRCHCPEVDILPLLKHIPKYEKKLAQAVFNFDQLLDFIDRDIDDETEELEVESFIKIYSRHEASRMKIKLLVCDLLMAGTETSSTTLKWGLILLVNNPKVQRRLQTEIDSVVPRGKRLPKFDDRSHLPYVEAFILEVMRYKTIAPFTAPHKTLCDTQVNGYFIPKETVVGFLLLYK